MHKIFGEKKEVEYVDREGAYLIPIKGNDVGVVRTPKGYFLLGGGMDEGETEKQCIVREILEEIGYDVEVKQFVCSAESYMEHQELGYFHPIQNYYLGELLEQRGIPTEEDHCFEWVSYDMLKGNMHVEMQNWALEQCWEVQIMSEEKNIRLATPKDAETLVNIYKEYIENTAITFETEVPSVAEFAERIRKLQEQFPWLVCEMDGKVVGYAYASKHGERAAYRWSVDLSVYVDSRYHRKHIATELYQVLIDIVKRQGYHTAFVGISTPNPKSEAFHTTYGFETIGTFRNVGYKLGKWRDVTWFQLSLTEYVKEPKESVSIQDVEMKKKDFHNVLEVE